MKFIKKHIFAITRFLSIYSVVLSISRIIKNDGDLTSNLVAAGVSTLATILIIAMEVWYKPKF